MEKQPPACDLCDVLGWYGDHVCDTFCPKPDPDCGGTQGETPYGGTPWPIPGTIEAENYDLGGEGVAYHDSDTTNTLGADRTDGVDIKACTDASGCGYAVGTFGTGEWMNYTVNVASAGTYSFSARTATIAAASFHLEIDGVSSAVAIAVPANETWWDQGWITVTGPSLALTAGTHLVRIVNDSGYFDLNDFSFTEGGGSAPTTPAFATAAGFTTIAANYDFSDQRYATQSNWLGCLDPQSGYDNTPHEWYLGMPWFGPDTTQPPCSAITQESDPVYGDTVLGFHWQGAWYNDLSFGFITVTTVSNDKSVFHDFPNGYYEIELRVSETNIDGAGAPNVGWWETSPLTYSDWNDHSLELDFLEAYLWPDSVRGTVGDSAIHNWNVPEGSSVYARGVWNEDPLSVDLKQYHTFGSRITGDGATRVICSYIDRQPTGQCLDTLATATQLTTRFAPIIWFGDAKDDVNMYVRRATIWSCPTWQGVDGDASHMCNGPDANLPP
jgi:hypothetical protein